ncbi:M16 family metallopeptidase [Thalassoglobus sp.]|uniref:M16 family metallopeptidase n=1 Tax=Thalassoglobus sp. TaxID=2795869 RepID=UPI003AA7DA25
MPEQSIHTIELSNGLTLLVEQMPHVQSAAFSLLTPAGTIYENRGENGMAAVALDMMTRGAGERNSRQLSAALDFLGVQGNDNVGWNFLSFSGATLAENLLDALPIYADLVQRPLLPEDQFPAVMNGAAQALLSIEDEPQRKVFVELRKRCYDDPWGRSTDGSLEELEKLNYPSVVEYIKKTVRPNGSLIGVAGNVDAEEIRAQVEKHFGDWKVGEEPVIERQACSGGVHHIPHESSQTHIGISYESIPYSSPDYLTAWTAVSILSGGSSSRLFTEVREKRGLCYSVYATLNSLLTEGRVLAYAGTTTERAQETLDVMLAEIRKLGEGIDDSELKRCKARAKSSLIMQQESTGARAGSIARDWFHLKRVKTLDEIHDEVEAITVDRILEYLNQHPLKNVTVLTIGAQPLEVNIEN